MKVKFETPVNYERHTSEVQSEICRIVQFLTTACNASEGEIRAYGKDALNTLNNFKYGFGHNHLWIKQVINGELSDGRLLIAEF